MLCVCVLAFGRHFCVNKVTAGQKLILTLFDPVVSTIEPYGPTNMAVREGLVGSISVASAA